MELKIGEVSASVQGTVVWRHSTARSFGSFSTLIPRSSPLFPLIDPEGNQAVETYQDGLFFWYGVTDSPVSVDRRGATVTAQEQSAYSQYRMVARNRVLRNLTAGAIVRQGFQDAMAGVGGWKASVFLEAAPTIGEYIFSGQTFANVLSDMMDKTGQEWVLGPDMAFSWIAPTGNLYSVHLTEGGDVLEVEQIGTPDAPVSKVIAIGSDGRTQTASIGSAFGGYWQREVAVRIDSTSAAELSMAARAELFSRRHPPVQYRLKLQRQHWSIREGDFVQLVIPSLSSGNQCPVARVVERTYRVGDPFVSLTLAFMPHYRASDAGVLGQVPLAGAAAALTVPRRVLRLERRPVGQQTTKVEQTTVQQSVQRLATTTGGGGATSCMPDGTEALPGWPFCNDINTGIWRDGANQLAISSNGKLSWEISQAFGEFVYFDRAQAYEHYLQTHSVVQADAVGTSRHGVEWKTDGDFLRLSPTEDLILGTKSTLTSQVTGFTYFQTIEGTPTGLPRFRDVIGSHVPAMIRTDTYEWWGYFGELIGWRRIGPPGGSGAGGALTLDDLTDVATAGQADGDTIVRASGIYVPINFKLTKLKDVDATAPTNGQVPTWDTGVTPNRFTFQTPSGGGGGAPTTAEYVATASDGTLSAEVVIPGLAGSADIAGTYGGGISEEYDSSTTGLTWTPGAPATVDSDTTTKSYLYIAANDATERLGLRSWSPGAGALTATCELSIGHSVTAGGNFPGGGLIITDSGNSNRVLLNRTYDVTNQRFEALGYTYAGGSYTSRTANVLYAFARYFQITRDGSNNWSWWWSIDGLDWIIMGTFSFSMTVANIGYRVAHQGSGTMTFHSDWLRTSV